MYVRNSMSENPYCITEDTTISKALDVMKQKGFHRLPVVRNDEFIGLITEGTITASSPSDATSLSIYEMNYLLSKMIVKDIMIKNVETIHPDSLLEEAAEKMRQKEVACLPVLDGKKVVGIITQNDIFDAFIDLLGYHTKGARYEIEIDDDKPGVLSNITKLYFDQKANITNLAVYHHEGTIDVVIRANNVDHHVMGKILNDNGFKVVSMMTQNND